MNEKTKEDYRKLAANFYEKHMGPSTQITPKNITVTLLVKAEEFRPGYFRRLKNALAFDQKEKGFDKAAQRINATQNPLTKKNTPVMLKRKIKPKQKRIKSVDPQDLIKLDQAIRDKGDQELMAVLILGNTLGCRPNEMVGVKVLESGLIYVPGSKKADFVANGRKISRGGCERLIDLGNQKDVDRVKWAVKALEGAESGKAGVIHKLQSRMDRLTAKMWPRRKSRPTLYSYRHQLGADLKASGLDRKSVAYLMGHQSTESVEVYGDKRKSSQMRNMKPGISADGLPEIVRDKHKEAAFEKRTKQEKANQPRSFDSSAGPGLG